MGFRPTPTGRRSTGVGSDWVDEVLLRGPGDEICLVLNEEVDRATLRREVDRRTVRLGEAGLRPGGSIAVRLPASMAYVATLLAAWRIGAQVTLLDHRLTRSEVDVALDRVAPRLVVAPGDGLGGALRGYHDIVETLTPHPGRDAPTPHALVQLSSGSTGPSKVIGRTAAELLAEIHRYRRINGMPHRGERMVVLSSLIHAFGLIGGLLYGLHSGVPVVLPGRQTAAGILAAIAAGSAPTTVLGVPFHVELLCAVTDPPALPGLARVITAGELIRPEVPGAFVARYGVPLGECYGMTEMGVIAMDTAGRYRPAVGPPAPDIEVRLAGAELLVRRDTSPYLGQADPTRWVDGWLHTRDAARIDPGTGAVRILGRLDSQVAVGGLKVDLTEVEQTIAAIPGVLEAIVVYDEGIDAYLVLDTGTDADAVAAAMASRLAPFKRPRRLHVVPRLPRTSSGKRRRDVVALRAATQGAAA